MSFSDLPLELVQRIRDSYVTEVGANSLFQNLAVNCMVITLVPSNASGSE